MYARDQSPSAQGGKQSTVSDAVIQAATVALSMLADATRLRLMAHLIDGEQDVTALTTAVSAARPAVSQHLAKLRLAGLVIVRRDGRRAVYAIAGPHLQRLVTEALQAAEHQVDDSPAHHAEPPPGPTLNTLEPSVRRRNRPSTGRSAQPDGGVDAAPGGRA